MQLIRTLHLKENSQKKKKEKKKIEMKNLLSDEQKNPQMIGTTEKEARTPR